MQVSYRWRLRSLLLYLCYVFRALINTFVCLFIITKTKLKKLCSLLQSQNFEDILEARSIDESARVFTKGFMNYAQEYMPVETV